MPLAATIARRLRGSVSRRIDRVKDRLRGREATPVAAPIAPVSPAPAPVAAQTPAAPAPALAPAVDPATAEEMDGVAPMTLAAVEALFEDMVRPALQMDGGDITLVKVENNDVFVELIGACQTCPSSIITMQNGIERLLQEEFPQFSRLIRVGAGA